MRFLLDTNAVIALFKNTSPRLNQRVRACQVTDIGLSAIVAHELFYGAFKSQRQEHNLQRVEQIGFPLAPWITSSLSRHALREYRIWLPEALRYFAAVRYWL